ncbi:MAG: hypothetical protein ACTSQZ_09665 [Candidatus Thorarchaeota archaeon]
MKTSSERTGIIFDDPKVTPSILANVPECLRNMLQTASKSSKNKRKSILISSNNLANRFILDRWGIKPSQRRRFKNLFASIRKQCRNVFHHFLANGRMEWEIFNDRYVFGVYKFDEIRGNLILAFVKIAPDKEWALPVR